MAIRPLKNLVKSEIDLEVKVQMEKALFKCELLPELLQAPHVIKFYQNIIEALSFDRLNAFSDKLGENAKITTYDNSVKSFPIIQGGALHMLFTQFSPLEDEYLVDIDGDSEWFVLTNLRLVQKDGVSKSFKSITLSEIESYERQAGWTGSLSFKMKSGDIVEFKKLDWFPSSEYLDKSMQCLKSA